MRYARLRVEEVEARRATGHGVRRCTYLRTASNHSGPHRNRVLRPLLVAHHPRGDYARFRRLDRASLQPAQAPLGPRHDPPGRIREQIHSDGTSRPTLCPPNGVKARRSARGVTADAGQPTMFPATSWRPSIGERSMLASQAGAGMYNGRRDVASRCRIACRPQSGLVPG
jgi:hypothetical protein